MIPIAETFISIQGEGRWNGQKSVFLRLSGCNLNCGNVNLKKVKDTTNQKEIEQNKNKNAKWVCDSTAKWLHGNNYTYEQILKDWEEKLFLEAVKDGVHVILTGGEPLLQQNNSELLTFLKILKINYGAYIEVETNGTIRVNNKEFLSYINWWNISPKLSNSGMSERLRYKESVIMQLKSFPHCFKFVIHDEHDYKELEKTYIKNLLSDDLENVYLMPSCNNRIEHNKISLVLKQLIKQNNHYKYSPRLQIAYWDRCVGV